jgi:hypothetical protein
MMYTDGIKGLIEDLRRTRSDVAERTAGLAEMDIARTALKAEIIGEMTSKGIAVTPAEKASSQDSRMILHTHERVAAELRRDQALGEAEALRFHVQLALIEAEDAMRTGHVETDSAPYLSTLADEDAPADDATEDPAQLALAAPVSNELPF